MQKSRERTGVLHRSAFEGLPPSGDLTCSRHSPLDRPSKQIWRDGLGSDLVCLWPRQRVLHHHTICSAELCVMWCLVVRRTREAMRDMCQVARPPRRSGRAVTEPEEMCKQH